MNTKVLTSFNRSFAFAMFLLGCLMVTTSAHAKSILPTTGRVLMPADILQVVPGSTFGDVAYAEVDSRWLKNFYGTFREELFRNDPVKAQKRLNCPRFAGYYTEMAQARFSSESFHSEMRARALALGTIWYVPAGQTVARAVVVAFTERGRIFIDPRNGDEVTLSAQEVVNSTRRSF